MTSIGQQVEHRELGPGDLVCFRTCGDRINHVGVFIGNDTAVNPFCSGGVTKDRLQ